MASISGRGRSGGKIVRARRAAAPRTPYDRPTPRLLPNSGPENPNWLSRLILSPSRLIVSGAGKVLSSVFGSESSASSSSSSDVDSTSDGEMDDGNDDRDISSESAGVIEMRQTSEVNNTLVKDPQTIEWKSETKRVIEQLLMKETFSREECDRLTLVIKSRVVESPIPRSTEDGRHISILDRTVSTDVDTPDLRGTAVTEAKKWLEEKRFGSNSKSESEYGTNSLDNTLLAHVTEGEAGSPVDLAKTYMRARPPWASPSVDGIQSLSQTGLQLFKESTPISVGGNSLTSSKLYRHSPATGSWNILEELRKVRSKATEEMLRNRPSSKIDWSVLASDYKGSSSLFVADKVEAPLKDKMDGSTHLVDVPLNWASTVTSHGVTDPEKPQDGQNEEAFPPNSAASVTEQRQALEAMPMIDRTGGVPNGSEGMVNFVHRPEPSEIVEATLQRAIDGDAPMDTDDSRQAVSSVAGADIDGSRLLEINFSTSKEDGGRLVSANGFPSTGSSLPAGQDRDQKSMHLASGFNPAGSSDDKNENVPPEVACELLTEVSVEVPTGNENDRAAVATGSQNSSSIQHELLSEDIVQQNPNGGSARGTDGVPEKQQGRRGGRYIRRGRARGTK
ncbi:hypothetical protein Tsubulata_030854 [Turnera subulata]|uniref:Protein KAKU4 n=1 Tax=Turnera subulata TaxID=218843 RepID=A0A9Q0JCM6_9ROSI|nr:hypothetical protein Tsubulata_030854 [Turnera subulata]